MDIVFKKGLKIIGMPIVFGIFSIIFSWVIFFYGGGCLADYLGLYTNYDGEILFEDSAIMNWKMALFLGSLYYLMIMSFFFGIFKLVNMEYRRMKIHLKFLGIFNLLLCFGIGYLLSSPFF